MKMEQELIVSYERILSDSEIQAGEEVLASIKHWVSEQGIALEESFVDNYQIIREFDESTHEVVKRGIVLPRFSNDSSLTQAIAIAHHSALHSILDRKGWRHKLFINKRHPVSDYFRERIVWKETQNILSQIGVIDPDSNISFEEFLKEQEKGTYCYKAFLNSRSLLLTAFFKRMCGYVKDSTGRTIRLCFRCIKILASSVAVLYFALGILFMFHENNVQIPLFVSYLFGDIGKLNPTLIFSYAVQYSLGMIMPILFLFYTFSFLWRKGVIEDQHINISNKNRERQCYSVSFSDE